MLKRSAFAASFVDSARLANCGAALGRRQHKETGPASRSNVRNEVPSKTEFNRRTEAAFPSGLCTI
jgi:hypothetical protein